MGPQDASDRIWLKQAIQFSVNGQVRTIEIALPIRPGASAEEVERLLRQADVGLDQMTQHLNRKVEEALHQQRGQITGGEIGASGRAVAGGEASLGGGSSFTGGAPRPEDKTEGIKPLAAPRVAGNLPMGTGPKAGVAGHPSDGAGWPSMRAAETASSTSAASLDRKQFISELAVLGLNPRQAMERLGIRSLDGINLRQALEQLRLQLLHERSASVGGAPADGEDGRNPASGTTPRAGTSSQSGPLPRRQLPETKQGPLLSQVAPLDRVVPLPLLEGELALDDEALALASEAVQEQGEGSNLLARPSAPIPIWGDRKLISLQERAKAQAMLERLRRLRGRLNPPSSDNLKAFRNVVENQLGARKTAALLRAIWDIDQPERLSPDQVAECIRWGKDDHFEEEVDMLLNLTATRES